MSDFFLRHSGTQAKLAYPESIIPVNPMIHWRWAYGFRLSLRAAGMTKQD
jgi:hypothetical protein